MSPLKKKKLSKIRQELEKLDNTLIKIIKKKNNLVKKVLTLKERKNQIAKSNLLFICGWDGSRKTCDAFVVFKTGVPAAIRCGVDVCTGGSTLHCAQGLQN